ncbi:coiled-coil domain-containing protein 22 [Danaus plexippus plexippus]|uniref:Coiled-coil domain-containing protein 22 homolog n=1 Tax=Danaus plexippus plexippus TaxID=278856 RepID=A0A212EMB3_DANPL|nr:coiled-coil domain-containing protein 22 [Danaus plexippus plexippus]
MEEVDSIIIHFLRRLNIDINEDIKNICDLPVEIIVESAAKCINTINSSLKAPSRLPPGVSQRIEVAAQMASICKDLGYQNDVGYQTFLYHNETELRQVFMFLIEKLPSEDTKPTAEIKPKDQKHRLLQNISNKISEDLTAVWIPPCCKPTNKSILGDFVYKQARSEVNTYPEDILNKLTKIQQLKDINKMDETTVIQSETRMSHSTSTSEIPFSGQKSYKLDKTVKELKETASLLRQKYEALTKERSDMDSELLQIQNNCGRYEADLRNIQNILISAGVTDLDSMEDGGNIMEKVHQNITSLHRESEDLTSDNLSLTMEIDRLRNSKKLKESDRSKCRTILINLKETAKAIKEECEKKEELRNQLKTKYERLKGGNKRHIYTKRILEIIGNVDKQNAEINKILEDTRQLQKEINTVEGQLDRCFSIADETLFKDAKRDDQAKKAYKLLALLHSECNTIVSLVNETGVLSREIIDLEDNIKAEKSKRTEDILQKIHLDLSKLQKET